MGQEKDRNEERVEAAMDTLHGYLKHLNFENWLTMPTLKLVNGQVSHLPGGTFFWKQKDTGPHCLEVRSVGSRVWSSQNANFWSGF